MSIKSELNKTAENLRRTRKAILGRGGDISITAGLKDLPNAIFNIPADNSLSYYTDEEIAYQKIVPEGAEEYALLKKVGGMTYKCNNLLPYPYVATTHTNNGITFTDNGDGTITANGTATKKAYFKFYLPSGSTAFWADFNLPAGSYYLSGCPAGGSSSTYRITMSLVNAENTSLPAGSDAGKGSRFSISEDAVKMYFQIEIFEGVSVSNLTFKPMLNVGTEPKPFETYYEGLRDTKVTEIVSKGENLELISYPIPEEARTLDGYGLGINDTCYNYVDFENKKFIKNVNKLVFTGEEAWDTHNWAQNERFRLIKITPRAVWHTEDKTASICNEYEYNTNVFKDSNRESGILITTSKNTNTGGYSERSVVYVRDSAYTSLENFTNHLKEQYDNGTPVTLIYKLLEPEIIDISEYFDNFIEVEGGGSLEFVNEYQYAIPSTVKYTVKVGN